MHLTSIIQIIRFYIEGKLKCAAVLKRHGGRRRGGKKEREERERCQLRVWAPPVPVDLIKVTVEWKVGWSAAMTGPRWDLSGCREQKSPHY